MRLDPTTVPSMRRREPFAWEGSASCAIRVMARGKAIPRASVKTMRARNAVQVWRSVPRRGAMSWVLCESRLETGDESDDEVDELDTDERRDDAAETVDEQVAAQDATGG